jgi:phage replication initiation protein
MKKHELTLEQIDEIVDNAQLTQADFDLINSTISNLFMVNGKVKSQLNVQKVDQDIAFIDWLNFTVKDDSFDSPFDDSVTTIILTASEYLTNIFGFGISLVRPTGAFFYERSYELGNKYGMVCHGGQNNSLLVSINGTGLSQAAEGWEVRLYTFLKHATLSTITRVDLAHDDFNPTLFTLDNCLKEFLNGSFKNGKRSPSVSQAGNWIQPDGRGRTLYIGKRTNGMFCRIYEKGLQLQSESSPEWVRCEVELKSVDRIIPLDVLLKPHEYFAGSFPIFNHLNQIQTRVLTYQHEVKSDIEHRTKWGKRQTGSFINLLSELGFTNDEIIEKLKAKTLPKAFKQKFLENDLQNVHELPRHALAPSNNMTH